MTPSTPATNPAPAATTGPVDTSPLRLGGLSPLFPLAEVADPGRLRLGGLSPVLGQG